MVFTIAHLSDLHTTPVYLHRLSAFCNKRALGWLKWRWRRSKEYRPEVLTALLADLRAQAPDHVVITGDLTNLGLEGEYLAAVAWLQQLGGGQSVSLVPGNHDVYMADALSSQGHWAEYLRSDATVGVVPAMVANESEIDFPTVRVRGPIVFIGVCSARPTGLLHATGTIGADQLTKLERILRRFSDSALCCVVLIHHPPTDAGLSARRRLTDAAAFRAVLAETGADLVLHGHLHKTVIARQPGPHGPIPVVGARSASDIGRRPDRAAQYHLYRIERPEHCQRKQRFSITMATRCYDVVPGCFQRGEELQLSGSFA